jgi:hypothetical protein
VSSDLPPVISTGYLARQFNVPLPTIVCIVDRLGIATRIGRHRAVLATDIPRLEDALRGGGFLSRRGRGKPKSSDNAEAAP